MMRCALLSLAIAAALAACMDGSSCNMGSGYSIGGGELSSCPSTMTPVQMVNPADPTALTGSLSGKMMINSAPMFFYGATALPTGASTGTSSAVSMSISGPSAVTGGSTTNFTISLTGGTISTLYCTFQGSTGILYYPGYGISSATGTLTITWPVFTQAGSFALLCSGLDTAAQYTNSTSPFTISGS
jgi:hypothetical protein